MKKIKENIEKLISNLFTENELNELYPHDARYHFERESLSIVCWEVVKLLGIMNFPDDFSSNDELNSIWNIIKFIDKNKGFCYTSTYRFDEIKKLGFEREIGVIERSVDFLLKEKLDVEPNLFYMQLLLIKMMCVHRFYNNGTYNYKDIVSNIDFVRDVVSNCLHNEVIGNFDDFFNVAINTDYGYVNGYINDTFQDLYFKLEYLIPEERRNLYLMIKMLATTCYHNLKETK